MWAALVLAANAQGKPVPAFDSEALFQGATHIAVVEGIPDQVGQARGQQEEPLPADRVQATVQRQIKGSELPARLTLVLTPPPHPFAGAAPLVGKSTYLVFLTHSPQAELWELSDPHYGLMRVAGVVPDHEPAADARASVLAELRNSLESSDGDAVGAALAAMTAFRDPEGLAKAEELSRSRNARIAQRALMYRFALGDHRGLQAAVELIEGGDALTEGEKGELAWSLRQVPIPVGDLNRLLAQTSSPILRRVVATMLSRRGDESSIPALVAGLADANPETQYRCIVGLCRITGRTGPGYTEFMEDPTPTLNAWRAWGRSQSTDR
jgi:hypothetical protein